MLGEELLPCSVATQHGRVPKDQTHFQGGQRFEELLGRFTIHLFEYTFRLVLFSVSYFNL